MPRLTKRTVDGAMPAAGGEEFIWDSDLKGFGLRVKPSGVKSYVLKYRIGSRTRRVTIGKHGSPWTPEKARERAGQLLHQVADGRDPGLEKAEARRALTVSELADIYLAEGPLAKPNKKASSWGADGSNIERHVRPLLGRKLAASLVSADIAKFQADVAAGKTKADLKTGKHGRAIVDGGPGTAARSLAVLGAMLQFAVGRKLIPANPARGVPLLKGRPKERFLTDHEVARLGRTLAAMEQEKSLRTTAATAIRLLLLTGCRKSEIVKLRWQWVDLDRRCLRLPDSKTGAKIVPLAKAPFLLLRDLSDRAAASYVLPAARGAGPYSGLQKDWARVRARANLPGVRLHDLRHSFASFAALGGHPLLMIGRALGHKQARTTEGYAHIAANPVRLVVDNTAAHIADVLAAGLKVAPRTRRARPHVAQRKGRVS